MSIKNLTVLLPILSLAFGYVLFNPLVFGICQRIYTTEKYIGCLDESINGIGYPLLVFSTVALVTGMILCRNTEKIRISWLKFTAWWLPLSAILVAITPETSNSWMPIYFIGKDLVTHVMAGIFAVVSLVLIGYKTFVSKK